MQSRFALQGRRFAALVLYFSFVLVGACSGATESTVAGSLPKARQPAAPSRSVSTLAGSGQAKSVNGLGRRASFEHPTDIALDAASGNLYVLEPPTPSIRTLTARGAVGTLTRKVDSPTALAFDDRDGHLYAASADTSNVMRIGINGVVSKFVHVPENRRIPPDILGKVAFDSTGTMQITEGRSGKIVGITPGKEISYNVVGPGVFGICFDSKAFYVVNQTDGELGKVVAGGQANFATSQLLEFTSGVTYDQDERAFYVADSFRNRILKVTRGSVIVFAGNGTAGEVDGSFADAEFNKPTGIVYDHATRALYVADSAGNTIRKLSGL